MRRERRLRRWGEEAAGHGLGSAWSSLPPSAYTVLVAFVWNYVRPSIIPASQRRKMRPRETANFHQWVLSVRALRAHFGSGRTVGLGCDS